MTGVIVVSGASGFIGQVLVRSLDRAGYRVRTLVRPGSPALGHETIPYSLSSGEPLDIGRDVSCVVHLAQSREYRNFPGDAEAMFRVNVGGTHALLQAAVDAKAAAFCLVSTGSVYEPFNGKLNELDALAPTSYLGASKLAAECVARPYAAVLALCTLRLFAPYGPGQTDRLVPDLIRRVTTGEPVTVGADGEGLRFCPTYVEDICDVVASSIANRWSGTFNVAAPAALSIREAAEVIGARLGKRPQLKQTETPALRITPDLSALARHYDMSRFRSFEAGIAGTIKV
jgi:UDP-glucose 4-epimerase